MKGAVQGAAGAMSLSDDEVRGQGRAMPGPGQPTTIFRFDCEIDPRDGRVQGVRVSG